MKPLTPNPLPTQRAHPNEFACREYLVETYGPQAQKNLVGALEAFFFTEFPQLAGDRARRAVVQGIVSIVHKFLPESSNFRQGQIPWVCIAKDEVAAYGKTTAKSRMVPVVVSLIAEDEAAQRRDGKSLREIKRETVARLCQQVDAQKGCITAAELAILLKTTPSTIGKYIAQWETDNNKSLPRRGTIHDMGPTLTHKKEICRLLFLEGNTISDTTRITNHSTKAIDRYITNFRQVFTCKTKGLSVSETARATKMSERLIEEYHRLFDEFSVSDAKFKALLRDESKR